MDVLYELEDWQSFIEVLEEINIRQVDYKKLLNSFSTVKFLSVVKNPGYGARSTTLSET